MYYNEFREELLRMMKEQADEKLQIELMERQKLNGQIRYALMIRREENPCAPVIYLEEFYDSFCLGKPLEQIAEKLWMIYNEEMKDDLKYLYDHISCMLTFADAAPGLYVRVMHNGKNRDLLQDTPCRYIQDLALTIYYQVKLMDGQVRGTVMLRDEHIQDWSVSAEEVFDRAISNTLQTEGMYWNTLEAVLNHEKLLPFSQKLSYSRTGLHVVSGKTGVWGATVAFLPGAAVRIYEALGEAYYLLPSSIHEVIVIPFSRAVSKQLLAQTVRDVNRLEIPEEEILSDNIYIYNTQNGLLEIVTEAE